MCTAWLASFQLLYTCQLILSSQQPDEAGTNSLIIIITHFIEEETGGAKMK